MLKNRKSIWINRAELNTEEMGRIATEHSLSYPFAAILAKRGITSEQTNGFLFGDVMFDPALLPDMEKGCQYLRLAAEKGEKVAIVNDYDVDGVTSGTIMKELLQFLGAEVYVFAPDRDIDGYGISIRLIDEAISHGCRTIVTTDNGISAAEQIAYAKQNGCVVCYRPSRSPLHGKRRKKRICIPTCRCYHQSEKTGFDLSIPGYLRSDGCL